MKQIEWDDSLAMGIEEIDEQHKTLLQRLNDLSNAIGMNQGEVEIVKTLDFMSDYTDHHFSAEEKHMAEVGYPGLEHQRQQHEEFKGLLKQLEQDFREDGATKELADSIDTFLANWLFKHIRDVDHKFAEFLKQQGS
jgi:hemerythrin